MKAFRVFLGVLLLSLLLYTGLVIRNHGLGLFPVFFGDIRAMAWPGQFNLDFTFMLSLSALWVGWRHRFSPAGLALSLLALVGGSLFLTIYLLVLSWRTQGDLPLILLGRARHS